MLSWNALLLGHEKHEMQTKPVAIIGAGLAGLTTARFLKQRQIPFVLYEAGSQVAGMAKSFRDDEGFSYDFGAHFITNRLASALGVGASCRLVRHYGETVALDGRHYGYPFGLLAVPRYVMSAVAAHLDSSTSLAQSAADSMRQLYGRVMAEEIAIPLIEAWSGENANTLSSAVVEKLPSGVLKTMMLKVAARVMGRAIAIGYSREAPETTSVWHVYPESGLGSMLEAVAAPVRDEIKLNSPAEAIYVENERAVGVRSAGVDQEVAAVVSTAPCNVLPKLVRGTNKLEHLRRFRYRAMIFVNLRLRGRNLLRDTVVWTPEPQFPFFRLTEAPVSMPWLAPSDKTIITADLGCQVGDESWKSSDEALVEKCISALDPFIPSVRQQVIGARVLRTPIAYPVFHLDYEAQRQAFKQSTDIAGLYSIGRNGEFEHILMEDVYWRTLKKCRQLARYITEGVPSRVLDARLSA